MLLPKNEKGAAGDSTAMRPIAVASILYRGLMWILARRLLGPSGAALPFNQRGFRAASSCTDVVEVLDALLWYSEDHPQQPYAITQCDLTKAYDSICHQALLNTLADLGLSLDFTTFVASLLTNLTSRIWLLTGLSPQFRIERGIRQGCPLSPLLFAMALGHRM